MLYHNVRVAAHYLRWLDAVIVGLASAGVWRAGLHFGLWTPEVSANAVIVFSGALVAAFAWLAGTFQVYHARRTEHIARELSALFRVLVYASAMSCLAVETIAGGLPGPMYGATLGIASVLLLGVRIAMRVTIRRLRRAGREYRVWLLVGRNHRSARIAADILANPHFGIRIAQILDVAGSAESDSADRLQPFAARPLSLITQREAAGVQGVREIIERTIIDEVVITLPLRTHYDEIQQVLRLCQEAGVSVKFSPDAFERAGAKIEVSEVGGIPMVTHFSGPSDAAQLMFKRFIDILGSALALVVLAPLVTLIAAFIKRTSPGPVLFVQQRVGLHGRTFSMLKFRTMVHDAPRLREEFGRLNETDGAAFKIRNDPRIYPLGRILRKYHFDELPQLWNVLIGDMSLVGPRPLPPLEAPGQEWWQRRRLSMPPGMTCSWQAEGDHTMPFRRWMELDLAYIDQWSIWLDLRLMFRTLLMLPRGSGW